MILPHTTFTSHRSPAFSILLLFCSLLVTLPAIAQQTPTETPAQTVTSFKTEAKPQWEFGLAAAGLSVPAYPASAVSSERGFLVPWFIYRGDKVRLQDGGLKLIALQNQRVTIDVSISGSLNADSEDTPLRQGMPDLDYLLELGPKIDVRLWESESAASTNAVKGYGRINWSTALRLAVSTDFKSIRSRGPVLGTELRYKRDGLFGRQSFVSASASAYLVGEKLMDYFYQVDPAFVTEQRAAFDAKAGYIGSGLSLGIGHQFNKDVSGFIGVRLALHGGAKNSDSPLFEDNTNTGIFGGVSWTIKKSRKTINVMAEN